LRPGDIILSWERGGKTGTIDSPFDLDLVDSEQRPLGRVILHGLRDGVDQAWKMGPSWWEIEARPNFIETIYRKYQYALRQARNGKRMTPLAIVPQQSSESATWVPVWVSFRVGQSLAENNRWSQADAAYKEALRYPPEGEHTLRALVSYKWTRLLRGRNRWVS